MTASCTIRIHSARALSLSLAILLLAACAEQQPKPPAPATTTTQPPARPSKKPWKPLGPYTPGGLYAPGVADGAPDVPPDIAKLPEPVPHPEPLAHYGNRSPYVVLGKSYTVLPSAAGYVERGMASWYGTKFDGRVTSSLEPYDLSQFSAAHRTLPLPSYARVTNLENGRSVIVRINDRGPFHEGRLIDLSYAAAIKLGVNVHGTAMVEVRGIDTSQAAAGPSESVVAKSTAKPVAAMPRHAIAPEMPSSKPGIATMTTTDDDEAGPRPAAAGVQAAVPPGEDAPAPPKPAARTAGSGATDTQVSTASASEPASSPGAMLPAPSASTSPPPSASSVAAPPPAKPQNKAVVAPVAATPTTPVAPTGTSPLPAAASTAASTTVPPSPVSTSLTSTASVSPPPAATNAPVPQLGHPAVDPSTRGFLQVASYGDRGNAERMLQRLQQAGIEHVELVSVQVADQTLWRVHVGPMRADEAATVAEHLQAIGFGSPPFFKE